MIEVMRLIRFGIVGFTALGIYWAVTNGLVTANILALLPAAIVGYVCSGLVSYFGHLYFSFGVAANHSAFALRFVMIAALGLVINVVLIRLCAKVELSPAMTTAMVGITIPVINYGFNRLYVFAAGIDEADPRKRSL